MSSPRLLTAQESLDLLARLKTAIAQVSAEEVRSLSELQKRRLALQRKYRDASTRATLHEETLAEEETASIATLEMHLNERHVARRARIQSAYRTSMQKLQVRAQRKKEQFLGELQLRHFRAERQMPAELGKLDKEHAEAVARLSAQAEALTALEIRAGNALQGVPSVRAAVAGDRVVDPASPDAPEVFDGDLQSRLNEAEFQVAHLEQLPLLRLFRHVPAGLLYLVALLLGGVVAFVAGLNPVGYSIGAATAAMLSFGIFAMQRGAVSQAAQPAAETVATLDETRRTYDRFSASTVSQYEQTKARVEKRYADEFADIEGQWGKGDDVAARFAKKNRSKLETQVLRLMGKNERGLAPRLETARKQAEERKTLRETKSKAERAELETAQTRDLAALNEEESKRWEPIEARWASEVLPLYREVQEAQASALPDPCPKDRSSLETWRAAQAFQPAIPLGRLALDLAPGAKGALAESRLTLPGPHQVELPLALVFPDQGSLLFESADSSDPVVVSTLNNTILRMFCSVPAGKLSVTIIDPVGLGQNFAGLMTLGDYEESLINRRIWTQRDQIDERLADLNEHIEKMIQMYLRDEFATISQYNLKAGSVAEKYHLLVVADFPSGFSETAAQRLQSIAVSGPRCGVFTCIHWDSRQPHPDGLAPVELRKKSVCLQKIGTEYVVNPAQNPAGAALLLDRPMDQQLAASLVHQIGKSSVDSNRVEVPFSQIAPGPGELWKSETTQELRVPIGRTGATKLQYLAIGKGTRQHALFAGKTGSGKSTLFHVIITNLSLWCSPDQVEFYLIDFKKGVEFKCYASRRLPHARVVAIESDREFALSVLQRVDEELRRRGDLFRALGVQDVAGYKRAGGNEPMPRTLLIIDEFQEFFVDDDPTAQSAALLFDRIVRQGRAFGIHVLLGSQTLGGAYTLARATLGQMAIRVALQCNEADAYLIMDDNNAAPRLLSRPGEGIYNDAAGALEGNSPFQVVWLSDEERDRMLDEVHLLAESHHLPTRTPVVFEGNAPAAVAENDLLREVIEHAPTAPPHAGRVWLGAPNAIKGPTEVRFRRQSGNHLLIVGQREETSVTMLTLALIALAAQHPPGTARFVFFATAAPGSAELAFIEQGVQMAEGLHASNGVRHQITLVRGGEVSAAMNELSAELKERSADEASSAKAPTTFLFIQGLQRFKKLRHEDDFSFSSSADDGANPGAQLNEIITDGSSHGIHLVVAVDTLSNVQRWLSRKAIGEFELRVLFQMSANDSASLIDSPQASGLGLHRALLYNEQEGTLETFRPYARPESPWLSQVPAPEVNA